MTSFRELSSGLEVKAKFFLKDSVSYSICYSHLSSILDGGSNGKASAYSVGDLGFFPGLGRSSGEGNGNPLQYSCWEEACRVPWGRKRLRHNLVSKQQQWFKKTKS